MKLSLSIFAFALLLFFRASAQISVEVVPAQDEFLQNEALPVAVRITNRSGQQLHFGDDPAWLTFSVESVDGFVVIKNSEVPVTGEFDLESPQMATKRVDLQPYFSLTRPGRYRVTATVRVKEWNAVTTSSPKAFDIISGAKLWSQDFGVPVPPGSTNRVPESRKYTLLEANYLRSHLQMYVQISDSSESRIFKVTPISQLVSFSDPEAQVDRLSNLNILCQTGAQAFMYTIVSPNGDIIHQEIYDYYNSKPRLAVSDDGQIHVIGGMRRVKDEATTPAVKAPNEVVIPPKP